jgi:perosamine synthetase
MDPIQMAGPWITQHEIDVVNDAMTNGWYGDKAYCYCEKFQDEFAAWHGRKHGIMTPNCTSAIHLLLMGLNIGPGDEVIVPDCTWVATAAPISYVGATPIFCDIDPVNWCLDPHDLMKKINEKTRAVIVVDLYGNMPNMNEIKFICDHYGIHFIEDAAEALGSKHQGRKAGTFGVGSVFSFHRTKTLTTGEGGMLLLDDGNLYERCMFLRDHGRDKNEAYWIIKVAHKYMPSNLAASLGWAQFQRIDQLIARKREIFKQYKDGLYGVKGLQFNQEDETVFNSVWATTIVWPKEWNLPKQAVINELAKLDVPARPFFYPLSSLPAYDIFPDYYQWEHKNDNAYDISGRGINLPCAFNLTGEQVDKICAGVKSVLGAY